MKQYKRRDRNRWLWPTVAIASLVVVFTLLELTNTTHILHHQKIPSVIPTHSNTSAVSDDSRQGNDQSSSVDSQNQADNSSTVSDHTLTAPTGNFVSNHFPGQNNSPTTEASTCNTTSGAACYIMFTNIDTGQITQLPSQLTDAKGSTSWYWDTKSDAHLTSGRWKVTAVATLNGQTKRTDDALNLTIQ